MKTEVGVPGWGFETVGLDFRVMGLGFGAWGTVEDTMGQQVELTGLIIQLKL